MTEIELELLRSLDRGCRLFTYPTISSGYGYFLSHRMSLAKHKVNPRIVDTLVTAELLQYEPFDPNSTAEWVRISLTDKGRAVIHDPTMQVEPLPIPEYGTSAPLTDLVGRGSIIRYDRWGHERH